MPLALPAQIWPQNWGWGDASSESSHARATSKALEYLESHVHRVREGVAKPLLVEEFGLARDGQTHELAGSARRRNAFYEAVMHRSADLGVVGVMPWAWGGEGRPRSPGCYWRAGDDIIGDPPHEPQGWYSIFDRDEATLSTLKRLAREEFPPAAE